MSMSSVDAYSILAGLPSLKSEIDSASSILSKT